MKLLSHSTPSSQTSSTNHELWQFKPPELSRCWETKTTKHRNCLECCNNKELWVCGFNDNDLKCNMDWQIWLDFRVKVKTVKGGKKSKLRATKKEFLILQLKKEHYWILKTAERYDVPFRMVNWIHFILRWETHFSSSLKINEILGRRWNHLILIGIKFALTI